jgi:predicted RNA-binding protein with PIN domain
MSDGDGSAEVAVAILADLPAELWSALVRAFRRAVDQQPRAALPAGLRPFASWKAGSLVAQRPRTALAAALAGDARLREAVAAQLATPEELAAARREPLDALVDRAGAPEAAALLAVSERWQDLALMTTEETRRASRRLAEAELARARRESRAAEEARARLASDLEFVRGQREELRRRAIDAEGRAESATTERDDARAEALKLGAEVRRLEKALTKERDRMTRKVRSARARAEAAESRARIDDARARQLARELEALAAELRGVLEQPVARAAAGDRTAVGERPVVRGLAAARPGRPCVLPKGLSTDGSDGVLAVLQCPGLAVLLDGYNVTKHVRGMPRGTLEEQRRWLVGVAAGVAARFGLRVTVAFDGADVGSTPARSARGVQVAFSQAGETADDLLVALLETYPAAQPVLVVTDDRALRARVAERDADLARVEPFLQAVAA